MVTVLITVLLLLTSILAGCSVPETSIFGPYAEVHSFTAVVEDKATGHKGTITLTGPVQIPDGNRRDFAAYALHESWGEEWQYRSYLDAEFRLVAGQGICGYFSGPCDEYDRWFWMYAGNLAGRGVGYPWLLQQGAFETHSGGKVSTIEWQADILESGDMALTVSHVSWALGLQNTTYTYTPGRMLPDSPTIRVLEYQRLGVLPPADKLRLPAPPPAAAEWEGIMFEGEDEDTFDIGLSHVELVESFHPGIRTERGVCVRDYYLTLLPNPLLSSLLEPLPLTETEYMSALGFVSILDDHTEYTWDFEVYRGGSGEKARVEKNLLSQSPRVDGCEKYMTSPWPSMTLREGAEYLESLGFPGLDDITTFNHNLGLQQSVFQEPEHGWHSWRFHFRSESHTIEFVPIDGTPTLEALIHPDHIARFTE